MFHCPINFTKLSMYMMNDLYMNNVQDPTLLSTMVKSSEIPAISIREYMCRTYKYFHWCPAAFVVCGIYMTRLFRTGRVNITGWTIHRIFAVCFVLAVKFVSDTDITMVYFGRVLGLLPHELCRLERIAFQEFSHNVFVSVEDFQFFHSIFS